jgi:hypothetical protein
MDAVVGHSTEGGFEDGVGESVVVHGGEGVEEGLRG